ncbi:MAG: hypothetical protein ISQ13_01150 [Candidatus Margulisbacteria bacterium]|nr:hypothetical protein [Candidatus Margulisiibacteriota bacterium]
MKRIVFHRFHEQDYQGVVEVYENSDGPIEPIVHYLAGVAYLFCDAFNVAEDAFNRCKSGQAALPDYQTYMALTKLRLNKFNQAKAIIKQSCDSVMQVEINLELSIKLGQFQRAKNILKQADKKKISSIPIEINRSIVRLYYNQGAESEADLLHLLKHYPNNQLICDRLVYLYSRTQRLSKNEVLITGFLKHKPGHVPYIWQLLTIYVAKADQAKLDQTFRLLTASNCPDVPLRPAFLTLSAYPSIEDRDNQRRNVLDILNAAITNNHVPKRPDKTFGTTPFYLSYHPQENKEILEKVSIVFSRGLLTPPALKPTTTEPRKHKPRVAIISQYFYKHSVMDFYFKTIVNFSSSFHVIIINVEPSTIDAHTKQIKKRADEYYQTSNKHEELCPFIHGLGVDAIIYPEVGLSPCIYFLAMLRLAPVQMIWVGHPETSGSAAIDYYISWKNFHNKNAQSQFTETLIQLKNFPVCYDYPEDIDTIQTPLADLGISCNQKKVFALPVLLFKIQPEFDYVIQSIVKQSPNNVVVLICFNRIENIINYRLNQALTKEEMSQILFKMPYKTNDYYALLKGADVVLEPFPFGGGNTVLQAMAAGTPLVTLNGSQLKGSFGAGFYRWIGATNYICDSPEAYVALAIQLANDSKSKPRFKSLIQANKHRLFNNMDGLHEFYDWLEAILTLAQPH